MEEINNDIEEISSGIGENYKKDENISYFHGEAHFLENKIVEINGEKITADTIIVATGSRPNIPPIDGLKNTPYKTSTEILASTKLPKKMIVIGGGYVATELGYLYNAL